MSESTNIVLSIIFPIYTKWYKEGNDTFRALSVQSDLDEEMVTLLYQQSKCILIIMEEYFYLTHYYMPSWRILSSSNKTRTPMEILFLFELARIRAINDIFTKFKSSFDRSDKTTVEHTTLSILLSLELIPPNVSKWKFQNGKERKSKSELMVPFYSISQLETSFRFLFLKINHVSFHSDVGNYIDSLLNRVSWLLISPQPKDIMDHPDFVTPLSDNVLFNLESNFILDYSITFDQSDEPQHLLDHIKNAKSSLMICNRNFIYRYILRYYEILNKCAYRSFIFPAKRLLTMDYHLTEMSNWLQNWLNWKFDKVQTLMRTEIFNTFSSMLIPPSDKEWVMFRHPLQYISESSVWTILYPNLKTFMVANANKDIKKIYYEPSNTDGSIMEYIVLRLITMNFAIKFDFMKFVVLQSHLIPKIDTLKHREMPTIVQSFNRYCLLYKDPSSSNSSHVLYEYKSIFDVLAAWIIIMIKNFKSQAVTLAIVSILHQAKKEMDKSDKGQSTTHQKAGEFTTLQTRKDDNDDDNEDGKSTFF